MSATQPARPRRARSTRGPRAALALACALGLFGAPAVSAAPDLEHADPAKVGLSAKRLERLTRYVDGRVSEGELAGSVVALLRKGKLAYLHISGHAEIDSKRPLRSDSIFRIRSMTKPITAVAVLILVEEGRIALQDPVTDWFPEFASLRVGGRGEPDRAGPAEGMRIHHLLTHTAGFAYDFNAPEALRKAYHEADLRAKRGPAPGDAWIARVAKLPLVHPPEAGWHYGIAYDILGVLVERAAGIPFPEFLRQRITQPLGMHDTFFQVPEDKLDRLTALYARRAEGGPRLVESGAKSRHRKPPNFVSGGGGLLSSASDYLRFAEMLRRGGALDGVRILSRKSVELMTTNHLSEAQKASSETLADWLPGGGYGLGVSVLEDLGRSHQLGSVGEYGWSGSAGTFFWVDPAEEMVGLFLTQIFPPDVDDVHRRIKALANQALAD